MKKSEKYKLPHLPGIEIDWIDASILVCVAIILIIVMFIVDFLKLILVAYIIAIPIGYYFMNNWLNRFAFKLHLNVPIFLVSFLIILLVSTAAVIFKSIHVSNKNPVDSLRYE